MPGTLGTLWHTSNFQPSSNFQLPTKFHHHPWCWGRATWIVEADWYAVHQDADWFHVSEPTCQVQEIVTCPQKIYTCVNIINLNNRFEFDFVVIDCFFFNGELVCWIYWVGWAFMAICAQNLPGYLVRRQSLSYIYVYIDKLTWIISSSYWLCPRKWILEFQGTLSREKREELAAERASHDFEMVRKYEDRAGKTRVWDSELVSKFKNNWLYVPESNYFGNENTSSTMSWVLLRHKSFF